MRAYDIALFLICFNLFANVVNGLALFPYHQDYQPETQWDTNMRDIVENGTFNPGSSSQLTNVDLLWGTISGFSTFVHTMFTFIDGSVGVYTTITRILPDPTGQVQIIAGAFSILIYGIYAISIAQFLRGVGFKTIE